MYNNDFIGAASYNIWAGVSVAWVFGGAFFFDLFWPERHEDRDIRWAWKLCAVAESIMMLASAFALTIITATRSAKITGTDAASARQYWEESMKKPALRYYTNPKAVAAVVLAWPGVVATIASTIILWMSHKHDDEFGPKSNYGRSLENGVGSETEQKPV